MINCMYIIYNKNYSCFIKIDLVDIYCLKNSTEEKHFWCVKINFDHSDLSLISALVIDFM